MYKLCIKVNNWESIDITHTQRSKYQNEIMYVGSYLVACCCRSEWQSSAFSVVLKA